MIRTDKPDKYKEKHCTYINDCKSVLKPEDDYGCPHDCEMYEKVKKSRGD